MNVDTWALVIAAIAGPVLAVQIERLIARSREARDRQVRVFQTLMATRVSTLSREHVDALNAVPVEFHGDAKVMTKWRAYLGHLNHSPATEAGWGVRRVDLYTDMLSAMSTKLNYPFEPMQIKDEVYSPVGHARLEQDQEIIREGLVALFKGERPLPLEVRSIAQDSEASELQLAVKTALLAWLSGQTTTRVHSADSPPTPSPFRKQASDPS